MEEETIKILDEIRKGDNEDLIDFFVKMRNELQNELIGRDLKAYFEPKKCDYEGWKLVGQISFCTSMIFNLKK